MPEFDPKLPYNDLPPLPPPLELIETRAILKQCIAARVALAELKQVSAAELRAESRAVQEDVDTVSLGALGHVGWRFFPRTWADSGSSARACGV